MTYYRMLKWYGFRIKKIMEILKCISKSKDIYRVYFKRVWYNSLYQIFFVIISNAIYVAIDILAAGTITCPHLMQNNIANSKKMKSE